MVSSLNDDMDGVAWEKYCETMLRHHYGFENFFSVPARDRGDFGIEFYTTCGTIFQCYYPDPSYSMPDYKRSIHKKINDDLGKLKKYEAGIDKMLDGIKIKRWVLLTPEVKTKDLLTYCAKKKKEVIEKMIKYIDSPSFIVKVETDHSFPESALFAREIQVREIDIPVATPDSNVVTVWATGHSKFNDNLDRKISVIADENVDLIRQTMIGYYVQLEELLDIYLDAYPNIHAQISKMSIHNLTVLRNNNLFNKQPANEIFKSLMQKNREEFDKIALSGNNKEILSMGHLSKWLAECNMEFIL
ncbi:hypothetical protein RA180_16370 [Aeromonas salmonicida]|uniref:hypothetical protein n=1 Tax=Aeromonas salmonicida TaxID=645 RepID=UPI002796A5B9|nr:hypothetical protein [Aeromonas salmonicida]MDQ1885562.1 hypothetical protein [Aeromonas salmonicida]